MTPPPGNREGLAPGLGEGAGGSSPLTRPPGNREGLQRLVPLLAEHPGLGELLGRRTAALAVPEAARAPAVAGLSAASGRRPLLVAVPTRSTAESLAADLAAFLGDGEVEELPAWETLPFERVSPSIHTMGRRCRVLHRMADPARAPAVVVASARALAQFVSAEPAAAPITLSVGESVDQSALVRRLSEFGYHREHQVEHRGEMAVRGSIVDVYPSTASAPVRIDFWGDDIDRVAEFSVGDQRSTDPLDRLEVYPARELRPDGPMRRRAAGLVASRPWGREQWDRLAGGEFFEGMESWWPWLVEEPAVVPGLLGAGAALAVVESRRLADRVSEILAEEEDLAAGLARTWNTDAAGMPRLHAGFDQLVAAAASPVWELPATPHSAGVPVLAASGWDRVHGSIEPLAARLNDLAGRGYRVVLGAPGGAAARLSGLLADHGAGVELMEATLGRGAVLEGIKLAVLSETDVTGRRRAHRPPRARSRDQRRFLADLVPGAFVVHQHHGVARFEGMVRRAVGGHEREYLLLAYRGRDRLYVPSDQVTSIRHYTGGEAPTLSRMGGSEWAATKNRVRRAVAEVAQELVVLYQKRMTAAGHAFDPDTPWQRELEDSFEYQETRDQQQAIDEVKSDMERPVPMDRLLVGDVGFGKTEIAVRAAFKAVQSGRQAAVLVPTTLLAQQHTQTFRDRYGPFPVRVETLSRFLTPSQIREVLRGLEAGEVDVVVGTHRMLSADVSFKRLGLLVIDEEQRFGVRHKEAIKSLRADVDVLTLTATPVPRTLEMSLTGIRDMSLLETPPADRQPILTYVGEQADRPAAEAIRRELLREGQVFYVHNRVADIEHAAERVRRLVPEARVAVAHGQMDEGTLERAVLDFADYRYDVLVCTTIIESGIDMPTVNTLVVDRADRLGLGQLHQIRGRVGRSGRRAYAYLFHPVDRVLSEEAYERLKTIGEATQLGSGYRIAMRDLEIRGAGNLLGEAQSGHIAAVGYDLYCRLVSEAVAELRGETVPEPPEVSIEVPVDAHIPADYIGREAARLEAYRRLAAVMELSELADIRAEWTDRFGPVPEPAEALLSIGRLRVECLRHGVSEVVVTRRGGGPLSKARYAARVAPVELPASRQVRLRRLYGDGAVCKDEARELHVPLRADAGPVIDQLVALLDDVVAAAAPAAASAGLRG
ncbi:MAG: transcription-repair coupling factor [Acidimicrobiaceae bacterium]|nr:transcription-repair coupling factor [Acidimicrobiaceae bacterium]